MKVFVYEYATGGGFLSSASAETAEPPASLWREGLAMAAALTDDFAAIPGVQVSAMWDARRPCPADRFAAVRALLPVRSALEEAAAFRQLIDQCDRAVVIAPETDGALGERAEAAGSKLLTPGPDVIALCADKQRTHEHLRAAGVPTPRSMLVADPLLRSDLNGLGFPLVLKPTDGCGSQDVQLMTSYEQLQRRLERRSARPPNRGLRPAWLAQEFCPGAAASVAVLCGPRRWIPLRPCWQRLATDGSFAYLGGATLPRGPVCDRARSLALRAASSLPEARGYLGVDIVLGQRSDGADDAVIEINPRLTTSYVGLRRATRDNLAQALWDVAAGRGASPRFEDHSIEFDADGGWRLTPAGAA